MENPQFSVSQFIEVANQALDYAFASVLIEGEVASFKLNQSKYIFFDLKDKESSLSCFMMAYQLRLPVEDGMKVLVRAVPKITKWGKFSLTIQSITPVGEGSLKKSFQLLKEKLDKEGLFSIERKRPLPTIPSKVAVISSTAAAGYKDFIKILDDRWGGLHIKVAHTQVQGESAPDQIIRAINYFNQEEQLADVLVIVRGGGSATDLAIFNDEALVRAVAASRIPVVTGIGHEVDESLVDLAADVRAATPTNAAQLIVPDRQYYLKSINGSLARTRHSIVNTLNSEIENIDAVQRKVLQRMTTEVQRYMEQYEIYHRIIESLDPNKALARGYAIVRGDIKIGSKINVETRNLLIEAEVRNVKER